MTTSDPLRAARQAKGTELIQYATEIKVRAERRCGELLAKVDRAPGVRTDATSSQAETRYQTALRENDIPRATADRYQQLAAMPDAHFETAVATAKATAADPLRAAALEQLERILPAGPWRHNGPTMRRAIQGKTE